MRRKFHYCAVFVSMLLLLSGLSLAQSGTTGAIEGKVLDEEGNPLPGAQVKLSSPDLIGGTQVRVTQADGKFRFVALLRGTYTLEGSLSGFASIKRGDVRVYVGQTVTVDLALKIGKLEEEVTVTGIAPLVDVKDSQLNATNLDKQMIQTVGGETRAVRASSDLINLAPGIKDRSAMGAAERSSNQWQLDGQSLLTFVGTGQDWQYPDINIVEEARVSGSGTNAEYGGFTGAVLNLVTKSGGNTLEGMAEVLYSPLKWNTRNFDTKDPMFSLFEAPPRNLFFSAHFGLGGAIVKDKLWYYFSGGYNKSDEEVIPKSELRESTQIPKGFGKLTFQPDENNRFSAFVEYEYFQVFNRGMSPDRDADATYYDVGPGMPVGLNWMHTFSQNTFAELKLGVYYSWYDQRPNNGKDVPERYDGLTGRYTGNMNFWGESTSTHWTANASVSHHADEFIKGSHDFKVGVEFLTGFDNSKYGYTGGFRYYDNYYGYSYIYYDYRYMTLAYTYGYDVKSNGWKVSGFAQDSWRIGDRLTINPGIRYSIQRGYLPNLQDSAFFKPKNQLEFRLGLSFDVFGDHTTAIKAHYGRFHESFKTWYFNSADPGYEDWVIYEVAKDGSMLETYRKSYATNDKMDPNIRIPYSDQYTIGLERTLLKDMVLSLTFIHREYKDFIAHVNTGAGWTVGPWTFENENGLDQTIDVYFRNAGTSDSYLITNPKEGIPNVHINPKNKYTGFSVALSKRFSDGWMFHVDYTYSVAKGNQANDDSTGAWGGRAFENPNRQIHAYGNLTYDAPHALNVYGTVSLPLGFVITPRLLVQSGYNWDKYVSGPKSVGKVPIRLEDRGSERFPAQISFDIRLEKDFMFTDRMRLGLMFDAFNIFNRGVETSIETNVQYHNYGKALSVSAPRYLRVGMRFFF